jgi:hypothetical protein
MTQPPDQTPQDPHGLPPEEEAVRRLLADARHDGPTPPEVVARLDATLASLAAERETAATTSTTTTAPVIDLGARRRRMAGIGLLAASAVVVAGVALGPGLPSMQGGSDAGSTAGDAATSQRELSEDSGGGADSGGAESEETGPQNLKSAPTAPDAAYPTLSSDDVDLDDELLSLRAGSQAPDASMATEPQADCDLSGTGRGRRVLAQVDGAVGAVVFRRPDGASQQVDLYVCGDPTAVRTLTLPAP